MEQQRKLERGTRACPETLKVWTAPGERFFAGQQILSDSPEACQSRCGEAQRLSGWPIPYGMMTRGPTPRCQEQRAAAAAAAAARDQRAFYLEASNNE